jgi:hypothetical protein
MSENYFIKDLARPFYEIIGEKALMIIYHGLENAKTKYKIIEAYEKKGFNSKIIFKKNASQIEKNRVFSYLAESSYKDFSKQVGVIAKPMMNFIISNYKDLKISL